MRALTAAAVILAFAACGGPAKPNPGGPGGSGAFGGDGGGGTGGTLAPCTADNECPTALPFCDQGTCVECLGNDHSACANSPNGPECKDNACGPCTSEDACAPGACLAGACVDCSKTGTQCAGKEGLPICDDSGTCVACLEDKDCKKGGNCEEKKCVGGCQIDSDCDQTNLEICDVPNGSSWGTCAKQCDPQKRDNCPEGEVCDLTGFSATGVNGLCVKPNGMGAELGGACTGMPGDCARGLVCAPDSTGGAHRNVCLLFCDIHATENPCGQGYKCDTLQATGGPAEGVGVCRGDACTSDADCAEGMSCNGYGRFDGRNFAATCVKSVGDKDGGEPCTAGDECQSGWCIDGLGVCYGSCATSDECADGALCATVTVGHPEAPGDGNHNQFTKMCLRSCEGTTGCAAGVECQLMFRGKIGGTLVDKANGSVCWLTNPGGGAGAGGLCNTSDNCAGIASTCIAGLPAGFCTGPCGEDLDCGDRTFCTDVQDVDPGGDGLAGTSDDKPISVPQCLGDVCTSDASCQEYAPGWTCQPWLSATDPTRKSIELRCTPRQGNGNGGDACTAAADCKSGFCYTPNVRLEDCGNGKDDDQDGKVDCADPDCDTACHQERDCTDGIDNDHDGAKDCADGDCWAVCNIETNCADGVDNDADGMTDCDDWVDCGTACQGFRIINNWAIELDCHDGLDDNRNGLTDCDDPTCTIFGQCNEGVCNDGLDNDGDGKVDCQDFDCVQRGACPSAERGDDQCSDGKDNDNDRLIDCADDSCRESPACQEVACDGGNCCADKVDNDGDGFTDCSDVDCFQDAACLEAGDQCHNGIDDDKDGWADCLDADCADDPLCNEMNCDGGDCCADGIDNDLDGGTDCVDADCFGTIDCAEWACGTGNCCADGIDSDHDGLVDCADPDCTGSVGCVETSCNNHTDDDGDGAIDCDDSDCAGDLANCGICFQACELDLDCGSGAICLTTDQNPGASVLTGTNVSSADRHFDYLNSCAKP